MYFRRKAQHADPDQRSARARRDDERRVTILRDLERKSSGLRAAQSVATNGTRRPPGGCRVRRLMRAMGIAGAVRGITTTHASPRRRSSVRSRRSELHGDEPQSALGLRLHLHRDLARLRLCGLRSMSSRAHCRRGHRCRYAPISHWTRLNKPSTTADVRCSASGIVTKSLSRAVSPQPRLAANDSQTMRAQARTRSQPCPA